MDSMFTVTRRLRRVDRSAVVGPAPARRAHVSGASAARVAAIRSPTQTQDDSIESRKN